MRGFAGSMAAAAAASRLKSFFAAAATNCSSVVSAEMRTRTPPSPQPLTRTLTRRCMACPPRRRPVQHDRRKRPGWPQQSHPLRRARSQTPSPLRLRERPRTTPPPSGPMWPRRAPPATPPSRCTARRCGRESRRRGAAQQRGRRSAPTCQLFLFTARERRRRANAAGRMTCCGAGITAAGSLSKASWCTPQERRHRRLQSQASGAHPASETTEATKRSDLRPTSHFTSCASGSAQNLVKSRIIRFLCL